MPEPADHHPELLGHPKLCVAGEDRAVEHRRGSGSEGIGIAEASSLLDGCRPTHQGVVDVDPANWHPAGPALRPEVHPHLAGGYNAEDAFQDVGDLAEVDERHPRLAGSQYLRDLGPTGFLAEEGEDRVGIEDDAISHPRACSPDRAPPGAMS